MNQEQTPPFRILTKTANGILHFLVNPRTAAAKTKIKI